MNGDKITDDEITDEEIDAITDTDKLMSLGQTFRYGMHGVPRDLQRALKCFLRAGELNNMHGFFKAADIYYYGEGEIIADKKKATDIYCQIVDEKIDSITDADEWIELGDKFYFFSMGGVPHDEQRAVKCYLRAGELNDPRGFFKAAEIYMNNESGIVCDAHKLIELYKKAGTISADFAIAKIYRDGYGSLVADENKALEVYREILAKSTDEKISEMTNSDDLLNLGEFFLQGEENLIRLGKFRFEGRENSDVSDTQTSLREFFDSIRDGHRALKCFARLGEIDASRFSKMTGFDTMARIYRYGLGGVPVDGYKAIECYEKFGGYFSTFAIAEIYEKGCGEVVADGRKALKTYREFIHAIEVGEKNRWAFVDEKFNVIEHYPGQEYLEALYNQARIFYYGIGGVPVNVRKAMNYYKQIVKIFFGTNNIYSLDKGEKLDEIIAKRDGKGKRIATKALVKITNLYRYGDVGIRSNQRKAKKFYDIVTYVDNDYLNAGNFFDDFLEVIRRRFLSRGDEHDERQLE